MAKSLATATKEKRDPVLVGIFGKSAVSYDKGVEHLAKKVSAMLDQVAADDLRAAAPRRPAPPRRLTVARPASGLGRSPQPKKTAGRKKQL